MVTGTKYYNRLMGHCKFRCKVVYRTL